MNIYIDRNTRIIKTIFNNITKQGESKCNISGFNQKFGRNYHDLHSYVLGENRINCFKHIV